MAWERYELIRLHGQAGYIRERSDVIKIIANEGARADFNKLLQIVSECAAIRLELENEKIVIAEEGEVGHHPPSGTLRSSMLEMIKDEQIAASLDITTSLIFGSFGKTQRFNAAFALDVADGVRAAGVAIMIHEMWENYTAKRLSGPLEKRFGPAHQAAVGVESAVMSELTGLALNRVASLQDRSAGRAVKVIDYRLQYLVISPTSSRPGAIRNSYSAARRDRQPLRSFALAGAALTDQANQDVIRDAVAILQEHPRATAGITGRFASQLRNEIAVRLKEDFYLDATHPELGLEKEDEKGKDADLGDLRSFIDSTAVTGEGPYGQVSITIPA